MTQKQSINYLRTFLFFFHSTGILIVSFLPIFLKYKGFSSSDIGWILAIGPFAALIAEPMSGFLSDKYKSIKRVLFFSALGMTLSSIFLFQMNSFVPFMIMGFIFYLFRSPVGALGDSLSQKTADQMGQSFGSIRMWGSIGFAISSLISGTILTAIGIDKLMYLYLFCATGVLLSCIKLSDVKVSNKPVNLIDTLKLGRNLYFSLFLVVAFFIAITHRINDFFLGLYLKEIGGTESLVGWAFSIGVVTEAIVLATSAFWFRKFHELTFIIFAGLLYSIRFLLVSLVVNPLHVLFIQPLHGITFGIFYVAAFQYVTKIVPKELQSTGHVLLFTVFFGVSGMIGSLFGGTVLEQSGGPMLYKWLGLLAFIGTIGVFLYKQLLVSVSNKVAPNHFVYKK